MGGRKFDSAGYRGHQRILQAALARDEFTTIDLRTACPADKSALVIKVLKLLEHDGVLERRGPATAPSFRWLERDGFEPDHWIQTRVFRGQLTLSPKAENARCGVSLSSARSVCNAWRMSFSGFLDSVVRS